MAYTKQVKQCNYCGLDGFTWTKTLEGWRLMDPLTGKLHACRKSNVALPVPPPRMPPMASTSSAPFNLDSLIDLLSEMEEPSPDAPPSILAQLLADV